MKGRKQRAYKDDYIDSSEEEELQQHFSASDNEDAYSQEDREFVQYEK